jgi:hypothetical protein
MIAGLKGLEGQSNEELDQQTSWLKDLGGVVEIFNNEDDDKTNEL